MPLLSRIARSIQGRMSKSAEENPDGALAKYLWLWQSMGKGPGRRLGPRPIRFFFAASLDLFSLVGWYVRTRILRVVRSAKSMEAIMKLSPTNLVVVVTIMAGGVIGGWLTLRPLILSSPADDAPAAVRTPGPARPAPAQPPEAQLRVSVLRVRTLEEQLSDFRRDAERVADADIPDQAEKLRLTELGESFVRAVSERLQAERLQVERLQAERLQAERLQAERLRAEIAAEATAHRRRPRSTESVGGSKPEGKK